MQHFNLYLPFQSCNLLFLQRFLIPFKWRLAFRNKIWVLDLLIAIKMSPFFRIISTQHCRIHTNFLTFHMCDSCLLREKLGSVFLSLCTNSQVVLVVKNPSANTGEKRYRFDHWVRKIPWSRKWKTAPVLAWKIPQTEEPGRQQSKEHTTGHQKKSADLTNPEYICNLIAVATHCLTWDTILLPMGF